MKNIDLVQAKRQEKLDFEMQHVNTFEAIAREWHEQKRHTWQPRHADNIMKRLEMHLFPVLGNKPIVNVTPPELLHTLKPIEQQGKYEMAKRMLQTTAQIYRYAIACGKAERNITTDLQGALKPSVTTHRAYLEEQQLPDLLRKLNCYDSTYNGNPITKWGFQLLILTFVRTSELRQAQWSEIDFDQKLWRIPAERMKMRKELPVPLSAHSIALFKKIHKVTGNSYSGYVLPSFRIHVNALARIRFFVRLI